MDPKDGFETVTRRSPGVDSRFTTRLDIVKAVYQALNGSTGQIKLAELDAHPTQNRITFTAPLSPAIRNIERFTKATSLLERGATANSVFLVIDRIGMPSADQIHIQTAYPEDIVT